MLLYTNFKKRNKKLKEIFRLVNFNVGVWGGIKKNLVSNTFVLGLRYGFLVVNPKTAYLHFKKMVFFFLFFIKNFIKKKMEDTFKIHIQKNKKLKLLYLKFGLFFQSMLKLKEKILFFIDIPFNVILPFSVLTKGWKGGLLTNFKQFGLQYRRLKLIGLLWSKNYKEIHHEAKVLKVPTFGLVSPEMDLIYDYNVVVNFDEGEVVSKFCLVFLKIFEKIYFHSFALSVAKRILLFRKKKRNLFLSKKKKKK